MTLKLSQIQKSPEAYAGKISVCGWVRTVREGKTLGFVELTDGSCFTDRKSTRLNSSHRT